MRKISEEEQILLEKRKKGFDAFIEELMPVLTDFAEALGVPNPPMMVADPNSFVDLIDGFMRDQVVEDDDFVWIVTRLGYFFGVALNQRLDGSWFLDEWPDTLYFLRYVIGQFGQGIPKHVMVDAFGMAADFVKQAPGRQLSKLLNDVERECRNYVATGSN